VDVDRLVVAGLAQQAHDPLRLAERIGADKMGALGKLPHRFEQLGDLARWVRMMAEHRQAEGRFGDEDIAGHGSKAAQVGSLARL
jgi:hypothetical protein